MTLKLITGPTIDPVTLTEVKAHLNISHSLDDTLLETYIKAIRRQGENITKRQFVSATYEVVLPNFPAWEIILPRPPIQSVTSVKYIDRDGTTVTLVEDTDYIVDSDSEPGKIYPEDNNVGWPTDYSDETLHDKIRVRYVTGYPVDDSGDTDVSTTPEDIKTWMLIRIAQLYEHREPVIIGQSIESFPRSFVDGLLDEHVIFDVV